MANRQLSRILDGNATDVLVQSFADRVLILVTQVGKVGALIQASIPDTSPLLPASAADSDLSRYPFLPPPAAIQLTPLLGNAPSERMQTLYSLLAAQLATIMWTQDTTETLRRSVIVGLALKKIDGVNDEVVDEHAKAVFQGVATMFHDLLAGE